MKKALLVLIFSLAIYAQGEACSCIFFPFCNYIQHSPVKVAVQARVIRSKVYAPDNFAVYLQVLEKYKDEVSVTDTIKVYGNNFESFCYVDVLTHFPVGDTVIVAFGSFDFSPTPINNPDALVEDYFEIQPILCEMVKLTVANGIVSGPISPGVSSYPLSDFEAGLGICSFPTVGTQEQAGSDFRLYPNPAFDGKVYVKNVWQHSPIEQIRVFSPDGRLVGELLDFPETIIEIDLPQKGIYVLEISRNHDRFYRKVVRL